MRTALLVLPVLVPMLASCLCILAWNHRYVRRVISILSAAAVTVFGALLTFSVSQAGIAATQLGGWPAPFGITLVADTFSAVMLFLCAFMTFLVLLYSCGAIDPHREQTGFHAVVQLLLAAVSGALLTGDMFNLFVWFELMLMSSFVLMAIGGDRAQFEGSIKYVALNFVASAFFLAAVGILYGAIGTLNMADLSLRLSRLEAPGLENVIALLFLIAFSIKAAVFPLYFWLPASYHTPPVYITTLFSALLSKVGVYALVRTFTLIFTHDTGTVDEILLILAALTMVTGVLGAIAQMDVIRLLSFHIISQIGYLVFALALGSARALAAALFFMVHVVLAKSALFLVSGLIGHHRGTYDLRRLGGMYATHPWTALIFLGAALSLAGLPPFSGFWAKLLVLRAAFDAEHYLLAAVSLVVSMLTLFSMIKIWNETFWKPAPTTPDEPAPAEPQFLPYAGISAARRAALIAPQIILLAALASLALAPQFLITLATQAGHQLTYKYDYITAVLGALEP